MMPYVYINKINVIHDIKRYKDSDYMMISLDIENEFDKIEHPLKT